jgi:uncharacterized phiE125 gp8 family phage protein
MVESDPLVLPPEAAAAAKSFVRAVHGEDDTLIEALVSAAAGMCESYTRRVLLAREFRETLRADERWRRLSRTPVRTIGTVEAAGEGGSAAALAPDAFAVDVDANGDGWLRLTDGAAGRRVTATYEAGLAATWADLPEALRHGIVRLAAHFYTLRGDAGAGVPSPEPPASVSALWRPYRRLSLG